MVELFGRNEQPRRRENIQRVDIGSEPEQRAMATVEQDDEGGYIVRKPMTRSQVRSIEDIQRLQAETTEEAAAQERARELGMGDDKEADREEAEARQQPAGRVEQLGDTGGCQEPRQPPAGRVEQLGDAGGRLGNGGEQGPGRRMGEDVVMHTGRTKRGRYTPPATTRRVRAQETTESKRYPRKVWNPQQEEDEDGSDDTSSHEKSQGEPPDCPTVDRDEYWHGMTVEEMAQYDTDQVHQAHYLKKVTGAYPEYNDSDTDSTSGGSVATEVGRHQLADTEPGSWHKVFKVKVRHTARNPTLGMLRKDPELKAHWGKIIQEEEYKPMVAKGTLRAITTEEVGDATVTPHVTTMMTKGGGREKARINYNGAFEVRMGLFKDRDLLYAPAQGHECTMIFLTYTSYYRMEVSEDDANQAFGTNAMQLQVVKRRMIIWLEEVECGQPGGSQHEYERLGYETADSSKAWHTQVT
jgi:hypothetical protein